MQTDDIEYVIDEPDPGWVSVSALQCRLRELFATKPPHRAAAAALEEIGALLDADYAVMHARIGFMPLSEEWSRPEFALREGLREQVNSAMMAALEADEPRCLRITSPDGEGDVAAAAVVYGADAEQAGSVGLVFRECGRTRAYELLVQIESLVGFLALLLSEDLGAKAAGADVGLIGLADGAPSLRLLHQLVSDIGARHEFEQVAVGLVDGSHVRVAVVNNEFDLRPSNPGVRNIRDAMSECFDVKAPVVCSGDANGGGFRLHGAWRQARGGGAVASVPLTVDDTVVAVVSMASASEAALSEAVALEIQREFANYANVLPMARLATRSLVQHLRDSLAGSWRRMRRCRYRFALVSALLLGLSAWLAFGTLSYRLTVPCVVAAMDLRVVSSPREGVLAELYVRPGDQVSRGQLLAELDWEEDRLTRAELNAEIMSVEAQIDVALGEYDSGKLRVLEAQREGLRAKVAVVSKRIDLAHVRAPRDGVILAGELREKLGARLAMGEILFELARYDGARVEMRVPEHLVIAARDSVSQTFVAAAAPDQDHELRGFRMAPASTVHDNKNVFVAEAEVAETIEGMPPGMEGFVVLDAGPRRASWVLTHRVLDWLRLNFWL